MGNPTRQLVTENKTMKSSWSLNVDCW